MQPTAREMTPTKMDDLEAMINEHALRLLHQKELVLSQIGRLQLNELCSSTKFSRRELKYLYAGWKVACTGEGYGLSDYGGDSPLADGSYGTIDLGRFQQIYAHFFPYGGDCSHYSKHVYRAMFGRERLAKTSGLITFADYAHALSRLLRGSMDERLDFVFRLYDLNGDDVLTRDELQEIIQAVYQLLGDNVDQKHNQSTYRHQADTLFRKLDSQRTGAVTREQFLAHCRADSTIIDTIEALEVSIVCPNV